MLIVVDRSDVAPGRREDVKTAMKSLAAFVDEQEPSVISYAVFFDEQTMTVVQIHPDAASMERHLERAAPLFEPLAGLVRLLDIDVYGTPSESLLARLRLKSALLGPAPVRLHALHAGFARGGT